MGIAWDYARSANFRVQNLYFLILEPMSELETARLRLRHCSLDDLQEIARIRSDPDVMRYIGNGKPQTRAQVRALLEDILSHWQQHGFGRWAITHKGADEPIGLCGLSFLDNTPEVELGYLLAKEYWNQGLATEIAVACLQFGFEKLNLDRIVAVAYPENLASQKVMKKAGMRYIKRAIFFGQELVYFEIGKRDFEQLRLKTLSMRS
jgi:RimJ/RimL family protein N-acetyltransferase